MRAVLVLGFLLIYVGLVAGSAALALYLPALVIDHIRHRVRGRAPMRLRPSNPRPLAMALLMLGLLYGSVGIWFATAPDETSASDVTLLNLPAVFGVLALLTSVMLRLGPRVTDRGAQDDESLRERGEGDPERVDPVA